MLRKTILACKIRWLLFIVSFMGFLLPVVSFAKEVLTIEALLEMSIEELLELPISSVSSASRYEQKSTEAPASISVITAEDIKRYGYRSMAEVLMAVEGLYFITDNNYIYPGMRSISRPEDYGTRIAFLINGHRITNDIYGGVEIGGAFPLDLNLIEKVEVVRGPTSSLYGQGAFLGVINVVTKNPSDYPETVLTFEVDQHPDRYHSNLTTAHTFENDAQLLFSATTSNRPGEDFYVPEFDTPPLSDGIERKQDYQKVKRFFSGFNYKNFKLTALYSRREVGSPSYYGVIKESDSHSDEAQGYLDASYQHAFSDHFKTSLRLSWNYYNYILKSVFDYGLEHPVVDWAEFPSQWLNGVWQWQWKAGKHYLIGGIEYQQHSLQQRLYAYDEEPFSIIIESETDDGYWAAFVQDDIKLTDNITLSAGVRYDVHDTLSGEFSPRTALIYQQDQQTTWKLLAGKAFRAPTVFENYYAGAFYRENNAGNLRPETLASYELILDKRFSRRLHGAVSAFSYKVKDLMEVFINATELSRVYRNAYSAEARGLELSLSTIWENRLETHFNYTLQEAEYGDTGERLNNYPQNMFKMRASLPLGETWRLNSQLLYIDSMYIPHYNNPLHTAEEHTDVPAYTTVDLSLTSTPWHNFEWGFYVYNLFDQDIYHSYLSFPTSGIETLKLGGRAFRVKLSYHF